jgi:hypothetical protein
MKARKQHYLASLKLTESLNLHCYLMCKEARLAQGVPARLVELAEERGFKPLPIILMTRLSDSESIRTVRKVLSEVEDERHNLANAKDYHCVVFVMRAPQDQSLMELH